VILLIDSSKSELFIALYTQQGVRIATDVLPRGRELSKKILNDIQAALERHGMTLNDIAAIGVYRGPGSFTGLRIGITVANALADSLMVPICGEGGDDWESDCIQRITQGDNDHSITPEYGAMPHITQQKR
jgi:tRNA threonylcarbamoyladenosine biosynthesis protein TsaB